MPSASGFHRRQQCVSYGDWLRTNTRLFLAYAAARKTGDTQETERARRAWREHTETQRLEGRPR